MLSSRKHTLRGCCAGAHARSGATDGCARAGVPATSDSKLGQHRQHWRRRSIWSRAQREREPLIQLTPHERVRFIPADEPATSMSSCLVVLRTKRPDHRTIATEAGESKGGSIAAPGRWPASCAQHTSAGSDPMRWSMNLSYTRSIANGASTALPAVPGGCTCQKVRFGHVC